MNNKGFTLIELLATIILLTLVVSISSYSIVVIIRNAKEKNFNLLISNIKVASELYYQECKYSDANNTGIPCNIVGDKYRVTLGDLVKYNYLKGNSKKNDKFTIVNPKDDKDISNCTIDVYYPSDSLTIEIIPTDNDACYFFFDSNTLENSHISDYIVSHSHSMNSVGEASTVIINPEKPSESSIIDDKPIITPVIPKDETD